MNLHLLKKGDPKWDHVQAMFEQMYAEFKGFGDSLPLSENGAEKWRNSMEKASGSSVLVLVSENNNKMTGFLHANLIMLPNYYKGGLNGKIAHLYVEPNSRKNNLATGMVERAMEWFLEKKVSSIELQILHANSVALTFWEKFGFQKELAQYRYLLKK